MNKVTSQTKRRSGRLQRVYRWWPWAASAVLHCLILAVLSAVVLASYGMKAKPPEIIPEARLGEVQTRQPIFQRLETQQTLPTEAHLESTLRRQAMERPRENEQPNINPIGAQGSDPQRDPSAAEGPERLTLPGSNLATLEPTAPVSRFFSSGGNAYNIIYLVDRSGSMIDCIEPLKRELKRSVGDLKPMQKFHVIFFSAGKPIEGPAENLTWATDRNKNRYYRFIEEIQARGQTNPIGAFHRAIELKPDLVYLLTDGIFDDQIAHQIIGLAGERNVKINTIAYVFESGGAMLRQIAEQTGGMYRFVSEDQLQ